jgi:hypothetical protein
MARSLNDLFGGRTLGVATLHGKERAIGPALLERLPLAGFHAIADVDTDRFGAFSGEVQRTTDPLTACIAKARHGAEVSGMDLVMASEGSFGPYPPAPFVTCNEEWLVLLDVRNDTVFHHRHVSLRTTRQAVSAFAERMQFPAHQLVVRPREHWRPGDRVVKGIANTEQLHRTAEELIATHGTCWVETDLRAMANPTRMAVIAETAERFASELATLCPACSAPWFRITEALPGLPCLGCGWPTQSVRAFRRSCNACGHSVDVPRDDGKTSEDPGACGVCNP